MTARPLIIPGAMPSRDANGRALPGKLRFYAPNSAFTTPKAVYTSSALTVPLSQPVLSDAAGRWPAMWADDAQAFDVGWSDQVYDATIETFSNLLPANDAVLASVALADAAATAAQAAQAAAEAIADEFGDVDGAITAATAQVALATAQAAAAATSATASAASATAAAASAAAAAVFDPSSYVPNTRTVTGAGLAAGGGALTGNQTITVTAATAAEVRAGSSTSKALTPSANAAAAAWRPLTDTGTVTWDVVADGVNVYLNMTATGRVISAPTNLWDGCPVALKLVQPAGGGCTPSLNAIFEFTTAPSVNTGANKVDYLFGIYDAARGKIVSNYRRAA